MPRGLYINTQFREFYTTYCDWIPKGKKKAITFRLVESVMVWETIVRCNYDHLIVVLDIGSGFEYPNFGYHYDPLV